MRTNLLVLLVSALCALGAAEGALHLFLRPSERSYGRVFGREIPPERVLYRSQLPEDAGRGWERDEREADLVVRGQQLTRGDLHGIRQSDDLMGYVTKNDARSANGWFQSNNVGAASRKDTTREVPAGRKRLMVFGESYAQCSRVSLEECWSAHLSERSQRLEVLNFGVGGYSMAQAYLRYGRVREQLDYDAVAMMFVPHVDLWRDVNVLRSLARWHAYRLQPRFTLVDDRLVLVPDPYPSYEEYRLENLDGTSERLRDHLRQHDAFYARDRYEEPTRLRWSLLYRLWLLWQAKRQISDVWATLLQPDSEAMRVTRAIFDAMQRDAREDGKEFFLFVLPAHNELADLRERPDGAFAAEWSTMVESVCAGRPCVDLLDVLQRMPEEEFDLGYDGGHFGPGTNRWIAEGLWSQLVEAWLDERAPEAG